MRNAIGQSFEPGALVARIGTKNGYLKYGVIVSVNEERRKIRAFWTHEPSYYGGTLDLPYQTDKLGDSSIDAVAVLEWSSIPQWMSEQINDRLQAWRERSDR